MTDTSFAASWTAAPGNVKAYQVQWQSPFSDEFGEKTVPGDSTSTVLDGLTPETLYKVSVVAAYDRKNSDPLTGQETTDGKTAESWRRSADAQQTKQRFSRIKLWLLAHACFSLIVSREALPLREDFNSHNPSGVFHCLYLPDAHAGSSSGD